MSAPARPRPILRLQHLLMLMLVLGVVLKPVLASVGELHEFRHDPAGLHLHDAGHDEAGVHADDGRDAGDDSGSLLHGLLHFAHCCGHSPQLPDDTVESMTTGAPPDAQFPAAGAAIPDARIHDLFRPPIAG